MYPCDNIPCNCLTNEKILTKISINTDADFPNENMPFRISAFKVFLTYSRAPALTKQAILYAIDELYPVKNYCIAEERHDDGEVHFHAYIEYCKKLETKREDYFDIGAIDEDGIHQDYHPNIQTVKKGKAHIQRCIDYCNKEDPEPLTNIEEPLSWGEMIETSKDEQDFLHKVRVNYPKDYALNLQKLEYMASKRFRKNIHTIYPGEQYVFPVCMQLVCQIPEFTKSLVVVGPAGTGKTTWAKQIVPKPCLFCRHLDSLKELTHEHKSIIFDDLDFKHLPPATQKFLVDMENISDIHVRYGVATIPSGLFRIFTANEYPFIEGEPHGPAIDRRINKLFI